MGLGIILMIKKNCKGNLKTGDVISIFLKDIYAVFLF